MKISSFLNELNRRNGLLYWAGIAHLVLFGLLIVLLPVDHRTVLGINTWVKPIKFALSIAIYLWTFGWYLHYLPESRRSVKIISWGITISMVVEITCIVWQASRAVRSHFNFETATDAMIFAIMGNFIALNTLLIVFTLILFLIKKPDLEPAYLLSLRLGLLLFILASAVGGIMIGNGAHAIGAPDGGAGLPFVNWSKDAGDLRISHFIGMHALQIIPFLGYQFGQRKVTLGFSPQVSVLIVTFIYTGLFVFLLWQSINGIPLVNF